MRDDFPMPFICVFIKIKMSDDSDLPLRKRAPWESLDDEDKPKKKTRLEDSESGSYDPSDESGSDY